MNSDTCQHCGKRRDQHRSTDKACPVGKGWLGIVVAYNLIERFTPREATYAAPTDRFPPRPIAK